MLPGLSERGAGRPGQNGSALASVEDHRGRRCGLQEITSSAAFALVAPPGVLGLAGAGACGFQEITSSAAFALVAPPGVLGPAGAGVRGFQEITASAAFALVASPGVLCLAGAGVCGLQEIGRSASSRKSPRHKQRGEATKPDASAGLIAVIPISEFRLGPLHYTTLDNT